LDQKYIIKKYTMNWGYKILIAYLVFVAGILFLVYKTSKETNELVTKNYYAKELKYQQIIDAANNASSLSSKPKISYNNDNLKIVFPEDFNGKVISGNVELYYAADEQKDLSLKFEIRVLDYRIPISNNNKGLHQVNLSWSVNDVDYYYEQKIFID